MEDNYLDKQFKKILSDPPDFQPSPEDLADMKMRLRQTKKRGGFVGWWRRIWWIPLLLLPLFISLISLFQQTKKIQKELSSVQQQISEQSLVQIDTIYQTRTVVQIDTIIQRIYKTEYKSLPPEMNSLASIPRQQYRFGVSQGTYTIPSFKSSEIPELINKMRVSQLTPVSGEENPFSVMTEENPGLSIENSFLTPVAQLVVPPPVIDGNQRLQLSPYRTPYPVINWKTGKKSFSPFKFLQPESVSLGLGLAPLVNPSHDYGGVAYGIGINGSLNFPKSWTFKVGLEVINMDFELKNPDQFSGFPIPNPEDPADVLHELKPQLQYLQIPFLLQKTFYLSPGVRPFVGAGMVALRPYKQYIEYEYIRGGQEYYTAVDYDTGDFSLSNFRLQFGADLPFGNHWLIRPKLNYQASLSEISTQFFPLNYWAIDLSLHYKF